VVSGIGGACGGDSARPAATFHQQTTAIPYALSPLTLPSRSHYLPGMRPATSPFLPSLPLAFPATATGGDSAWPAATFRQQNYCKPLHTIPPHIPQPVALPVSVANGNLSVYEDTAATQLSPATAAARPPPLQVPPCSPSLQASTPRVHLHRQVTCIAVLNC